LVYEHNIDSNELADGMWCRLANPEAGRPVSRTNQAGIDFLCLLFAVAGNGFGGFMGRGYWFAFFALQFAGR
jgi:hypothetical protein